MLGHSHIPELAAELEGRGPEAPAGRDGRAARVQGHERPHGEAADRAGGRAQPALVPRHERARTGAHAAERELFGGRRVGARAEHGIGVLAPGLVAAVEQVEQDRGRHDGHGHVAHRESAPLAAQHGDRAVGGRETEGAAAGEHERIDLLHRAVRGQEIGLARAGRAAHDVDGGGDGRVGREHRDAGLEGLVLRVADPEARDVGDEVAHGPAQMHRPPSTSIATPVTIEASSEHR